MANNIFYSRSLLPPQTSDKDMENAIQAFLNNGGKVLHLREDHGGYDKGLKKIQENLQGGFNPFSKEQALTKR